MKITTSILKKNTMKNINKFDEHYENLHCNLIPLDNKSKEYQLISEFLKNPRYSYSDSIVDIFAVNRDGERERFLDLGNI